jgi:tellurite resistance protein
MSSTLLDGAAKAWAAVCLADGRLSPLEERRFLSFAKADPALSAASETEITASWTAAFAAASESTSYSPLLPQIVRAGDSEPARQAIMRAAQGAIIADREVLPQEAGAIEAIAKALRLDPGAY